MFGVDEVTAIEDAIDKLAVSEMPVDVARLKRCADRLEGLWLREVGAADRDGRLVGDGQTSTGALMAHCRLSHAAAKRALGFARSLRELPETTGALVDGAVTHEHARVLASACTPARAAELRALEPTLVDVARRFETRDLKACGPPVGRRDRRRWWRAGSEPRLGSARCLHRTVVVRPVGVAR